VTRAVDGVARSLQGVADDGVIDLFGRNAGHVERAARGRRAEVNRFDILQRAHVFGHRRALAA
jgi:hypothetical protein